MPFERGMISTIETLFVFVGWMILLSQVWIQSGEMIDSKITEWKLSRAQEASLGASDYLVVQSHPHPWRGCAFYDATQKRVRVNEVKLDCLKRLVDANAPAHIVEVVLFQGDENTVFFSRETQETVCWTQARGVFVSETQNLGILGVKACV